MKVVLASANAGKLRELAALAEPLGWELVVQQALRIASAPETGATFTDNALIKARHAARASGMAALADDSGIEVDALGGRPGVHSARYAGEHPTDRQNLEKLLAELRDVPPERRTARYRCVIAYVRGANDPAPILGQGSWEGRIGTAPRGAGGFGYDPIFLPRDSAGRTAAELGREEKDAMSHRAQALAALRERLCGG
ncbi:MAG: RdgB/HAM1 family non-canonical purine NTP pyrophosphatase [Steroidobacteraceae bacterium]